MMKIFFIQFFLLKLSIYWGEFIISLMFLMFLCMLYSKDYVVIVFSLFEMDWVSAVLVVLSVWIFILSFLASTKIKMSNNFKSLFIFSCSILLTILMFSFSVSDYLFFYLSFEVSLVPTLFLILGWGYQPERIRAGIYMFFYTFLASLPLLVSILWLKHELGSYFFMVMNIEINIVWGVFFCMAFMVKFPMYLVHLWLPKAHVEAPVAGSMILAGILLKLGGYGLVRVLSFFEDMVFFFSFILSVSLWGGFVVSLSCLRLMDMKSIIAYSSVVHMGLCLSGLLTLNDWGLKGSVCVMIGHGLCSSGLFYLANLVYERTMSRSMLLSKGLLNIMPSLALSWFILLAGNMAAPPTINLLGEISLIISIISWDLVSMYLLSLVSFFSASYSLYLFSMSQHGSLAFMKYGYGPGYLLGSLVSFLHWFFLGVMILCVDVML